MLSGAASLALLFGVPAYAQSAAPVATTEEEKTAEQLAAEAAAAEAASAEEEVVVVGSRLRRDVYNSPSPIQVITRQETTLAGYGSTAQVLQGTAVTGGSAQINSAFGGFVTNGGPGANTISLRGLGAGRTLVLINGRRVSPAGTRGSVGSADLNVLPSAIIDRIEVLRDGASSIYGSDAIAGVINVITRKDVDGLIVEGQYNYAHNGGGDQRRFALVGGATGDQWHISGSAEIYDREGLALADRDWTQCNMDNRINRATGQLTDFIDPITGKPKCYPITSQTGSNGVTINTIGTGNFVGVGGAGSIGTVFNRWRPNSGVTTGLIGYEGVGGGATTNTNVRDTFEPRMLNRSLISGAKIMTAYLEGGYELPKGHEIYFEALVNRRESENIGYRQLSLDYALGSPLLPAGFTGIPVLQSAPTVLTNGLPLAVRAFIGFGNDKGEQEVDFYKFTGGVRGDLGIGDWEYDVTLSYSKSDARYKFDSWLTSRLANSLNVVAAPVGFTGPVRGGLTCAINLTSPGENCVPAPVLTTQTVAGVLPEDWKAYTFVPVWSTTTYDETVFSAGINGSLFDLGENTVTAFIGLEYRTAEIDDTPNINSQTGNLYNLTSAAITRGDDSVLEIFAETEIPVLKNVPGAEVLTFNISGRYTDYDSYGADWTYKVGGLYKPVKWFSLRSTYGTSYRAPALYEQFLGGTSGFIASTNDPCNNYGAVGVNPNVVANCASEGLPGNFSATSSITVVTAGGAAQGLSAETSKNLTVGAVFDYDFEEYGRLSLAIDYYDIKIENGVSRAGATELLSRCYEDAGFRAAGGFCNFILPRNPSGNTLTVFDSYTNVATVIVKGIDYNLRWEGEVGPGTLLLNASLTQYLEQKDQLFADEEFDDFNGILNNPMYTGTLDLTYSISGFKVRYGLEWIEGMDSYDYYGLDETVTPFQVRVPNYYLHNASIQYTDEDAKWSATLGIRNIADQDPPQTVSSGVVALVGNAPLYSGYDYVGRQIFLNFTKGF